MVRQQPANIAPYGFLISAGPVRDGPVSQGKRRKYARRKAKEMAQFFLGEEHGNTNWCIAHVSF
jgi:hypothetical protein